MFRKMHIMSCKIQCTSILDIDSYFLKIQALSNIQKFTCKIHEHVL